MHGQHLDALATVLDEDRRTAMTGTRHPGRLRTAVGLGLVRTGLRLMRVRIDQPPAPVTPRC